MKKILIGLLILKLTTSSCWLNSYGRGAGQPLTQCKSNKDKDGALCYKKCKSGYKGIGPVCWQNCPRGFPDHGAFCGKPGPYGRGAGYAIWDKSKCQRRNKQGCEKNGLMYYPKCRIGFHAVGCCICSPNCTAGQTDIGVSCAKKSYGRGVGEPLQCSSSQEQDGLLCYKKCKAGYDGVGPVCWNTCPAKTVKCGLLCVDSKPECTSEVISISSSVLVAVGATILIPFSGGASAAIAAAIVAGGSAGGSAVALTKDICKATTPTPKPPAGCKPGWTKIAGSAMNISVYSKSLSYVTNSKDHIYQKTSNSWKKLSGAAKDIAVGANRSVWVIGTNKEGGGYGIYRQNRNSWTKIPGSAVRIAVAPNGRAWVVNKNDYIYRYNGKSWQKMSGRAKDIGIGADGSVWVIGTNVEGGGFGIYKFNGKNGWKKVAGSAVRIAVGPNGKPWVVNKNDHIYKYHGSGWTKLPGAAKDIGVGVDGKAWVIGTNKEGGGYGIYRYNC